MHGHSGTDDPGHDAGKAERGHGEHGHAGHAHAPARFDQAFAIGIVLNAALVVAQLVSGTIAHSVALLADAVHNLGDVLGLLLAWGAAWLGRRRPTARRTYGWGRSSIMASLVNATVLLVSTGAIGLEAMRRLIYPQPVASGLVIWVALAAIALNGATALLFMRGRESDLNIRGAFLHMAGDAGVSFAVVVAAVLIRFTGWLWLDPLASLMIVAVVAAGSWGLLRQSVDLSMDAVPKGISEAGVAGWLGALPGVAEVHDLHIWALSTTETAATVHLVRTSEARGPELIRAASLGLRERFGIGHATIQIETLELASTCDLRPATVI